MAKFLITGAAGFIGSHLCEQLAAKGQTVVGVVDNLLGGHATNLLPGVRFSSADCCDLASLRLLMRDVDIVYHLAAAPHEGLSVFSPCVVTKNTYLSTVATATAAIHAGVKHFIFTSSNARYGKQDKTPFTEDMLPKPVDPYGIAKVATEQTLLCLGKTHGMRVTIAVPHNVYGPRQKYDDPYRNVCGIMMNLILQKRNPVIYGDGWQRRCFTYIDDCIDPLIEMAFAKNVDGEIINIGQDNDPISINELASLICRTFGVPFAPEYKPDRPCEVKEAWPSSDKARRLLDYKTTVSLEEGIRRMVEWIKDHGPKEFRYHLPLEIVNDKTPKTWRERTF